MTTRKMVHPEAFHQGVDCQRENEWCRYPEAHEHGGFACDRTCPCRDEETARKIGVTPRAFGWKNKKAGPP